MKNNLQKRPVSRGRNKINDGNTRTTEIFINDCRNSSNYHIITEKSEVSETGSPRAFEKQNQRIEIKMKLMMNEVALMKKEIRKFLDYPTFRDRLLEMERVQDEMRAKIDKDISEIQHKNNDFVLKVTKKLGKVDHLQMSHGHYIQKIESVLAKVDSVININKQMNLMQTSLTAFDLNKEDSKKSSPPSKNSDNKKFDETLHIGTPILAVSRSTNQLVSGNKQFDQIKIVSKPLSPTRWLISIQDQLKKQSEIKIKGRNQSNYRNVNNYLPEITKSPSRENQKNSIFIHSERFSTFEDKHYRSKSQQEKTRKDYICTTTRNRMNKFNIKANQDKTQDQIDMHGQQTQRLCRQNNIPTKFKK